MNFKENCYYVFLNSKTGERYIGEVQGQGAGFFCFGGGYATFKRRKLIPKSEVTFEYELPYPEAHETVSVWTPRALKEAKPVTP